MNKLSQKAQAIMLPKPKQPTVIKEVKPAVENPDNSQKAKGKILPNR